MKALISTIAAGCALSLAQPVHACPEMPVCVPMPGCLWPTVTARAGERPNPGGSLAFTSKNVTLMSQLTLPQIGGGAKGSSLYGWTDPLTGHEYAIMGRSNGTAFVDVTNPTNPIYVANLPKFSGSADTDWREPKVYGNYVYVGVDGTNHPIQVMNLAKLRNYAGTTMQLSADSNFRGNGNTLTKAHTLAINPASGYLYAARTDKYSGGIMAIDVRNPAAPVEVGGFTGDGITHETQVVIYNGPDVAHRGKEIAFNSNAKSGAPQDTFSIVDVTNKPSMTRLSSQFYPNARYIHQGWLTEDQRYFFQNDEFDEPGVTSRTRTHLWDVSNLDAPVYRGFFDNTTTSVDHNLYVKDGYVYQTNYTTGLRVLKIGDLASTNPQDWLKEVAWFDTYPLNDNPTFNGAWNNYPFFQSGNVIVSDIDGGLFVLRPSLPTEPLTQVPYGGIPAVPEPAGAAVLLLLVGASLRRRR